MCFFLCIPYKNQLIILHRIIIKGWKGTGFSCGSGGQTWLLYAGLPIKSYTPSQVLRAIEFDGAKLLSLKCCDNFSANAVRFYLVF